MAKQLTLNQTIKLIREIALSHDQINTVYFGDVWEFLAQTDNVYPAMFYSLTGSSISGKNLAMDFSLFFLDRQLQDETNETDVLSDQLLIAQDIFAMFNYPKFDWEIDTNVSIEFFTENEKDYLAGVKFDITLNYPMLNDRCQVPSAFSYPEYVASISQNGGAINYVKFLIDYPSFDTLPANGDSSKIYVTNDNNKLYRWVDNAFIEISSTSSTTWGNIGGTLSSQTDLQNALNAKAPLASPTFTGTVSGITKSMVGLGNVDNTTDLLKPISTATQTALNLKYDASNPSNYLTGITSGQITTALGFTPYDATNPSNFISSITSGNITTALGFTPSNDSLVVHLAGTETITGRKTFNPSVTAASAIAIGTNLTPTLVAAANGDTLVALDINPTFNTGAFTGGTNYGIRNTARTTLGDILSITGGGNSPGPVNGLHLNFSGNIGWIQSIQGAVSGRQLNIMGYPLNFGNSDSGTLYARLFSSGNFTLQNGGTFTDAGFRLDVVGTFRQTGSVTAASTLAVGSTITPTLVAAANSDVLVGLDVNPTFTNGAFTGVSNLALRVQGAGLITYSNNAYQQGFYIQNTSTGTTAITGMILRNSSGTDVATFSYYPSNYTVALQQNAAVFATVTTQKLGFQACASGGANAAQDIWFSNKGGQFNATLFSTGNLLLQNAGTHTDSGYRLDVSGTSRITTSLNIGGTTTNASAILQADSTTKGILFPRMTTTQKNAITSPATGLVVYDTTLNKLCVRTASVWETITSS